MLAARSKLPGTIEKPVDEVETGATGDEVASFDYAVAVNRWSMRLLGLWPLDTRLSHLRCSVCLGVAIVVMSPAVVCLFVITDWEAIMNQVNMTLPSLPTLVRFIVMKMKAKNLRAVLRSMSRDWANYRYLSPRDQRTMFHYAKRGRRINVVCIVWMILTIGVYIITPFGNTWINGHPGNVTGKRLPTEVFFPLEQSYVYEMMYVAQSIAGVIGGMAIFSVDCFVCVVVFHACGQLEVLAATLERHYDIVEHEYLKDTRSRLSCACLPCIVRRHVHIVNYMDVVERSFNDFVLCQLLATTVILAFQGFQILLADRLPVIVLTHFASNKCRTVPPRLAYFFARVSNVTGFIAFIIYGITFTFYIFIYCYIGDCIIEKSENIGRTAYNLEWINFPWNYARPIILLIARSRRPCKITAGRFATMTLSYYKTIMMTSLSYLSVLMAVK